MKRLIGLALLVILVIMDLNYSSGPLDGDPLFLSKGFPVSPTVSGREQPAVY
jgi:hypothetical protein